MSSVSDLKGWFKFGNDFALEKLSVIIESQIEMC
jgi:hypothetical protein